MSDFERRLRDALHSAAETPPDRLMDAVLRRHRHHQLRLGGGLLAVVAAVALAVPPVLGALRPSSSGGHGHSVQAATRSHVRAAAGTVLVGCADGANSGQLARPSQYRSWGMGLPLKFLDGGHSSGRIRLYVAIALLQGIPPSSTVVVRVPRAMRGDLRFLYGRPLSPGTRHTMRGGETGVTFVACRRSQETFRAPYTDYYGGYLVRGARCVPVNVWVHGRRQPAVIRLGACSGR